MLEMKFLYYDGQIQKFTITEIELRANYFGSTIINDTKYLTFSTPIGKMRFSEKDLFTEEELKSYVNEYFKNT